MRAESESGRMFVSTLLSLSLSSPSKAFGGVVVGFAGLRIDVMISILDQNYGGYLRREGDSSSSAPLETHLGTSVNPKGGAGILCWCKWSETKALCLEQAHSVAKRSFGPDYMSPIQGRPRRYL